MARAGLRIPVVHPVDLLARAYEAGDGAASDADGTEAVPARFSA